MKKTSIFLKMAMIALLFASFASTSCKKDDDDDDTTTPTVIRETDSLVSITSNITSNTTWDKDTIYVLAGRIEVESGATLTIEAGTIIKGEAGTQANATALLIARGGKIMAEGTATAPIIFTSVADEICQDDIAAGNFGSPNLDPTINGLWGGVIILGKAPISVAGDATEAQIEGIPTSDQNGLYGGTDAADNSGVLKYVSIRHGGTNIGSGNEINGLSLGGVGSGTTIENIEIVSNQDDGIEWFGGSVNVSNVLVWNVGDDGIDTDQAWSGTLDNFMVITVGGHCFELDGGEGTTDLAHTIKNGTIIASDTLADPQLISGDLINVDDDSYVNLQNLHFKKVVDGQMINRVTAANVTFTAITIDVPADDLVNHVNGAVPAGVTIGTTGQATESVFSWTWAGQHGAF